MQSFFKSSMVSSSLLAALGILLIFESEMTISTISYIVGAVLVVAGTFAFFRYLRTNQKGLEMSELDILYGIVTIIVGILVVKNPNVIADIIPLILGIAIIISSASKLQYAFDLKQEQNDMWKTTMAIACISALFGIALIYNPFAGTIIIMRIVGAFILVYAILDIASTMIIKKNVSEFNTSIQKNENDNIVEAEIISENTDEIQNVETINKDDNINKNNKKKNSKKKNNK